MRLSHTNRVIPLMALLMTLTVAGMARAQTPLQRNIGTPIGRQPVKPGERPKAEPEKEKETEKKDAAQKSGGDKKDDAGAKPADQAGAQNARQGNAVRAQQAAQRVTKTRTTARAPASSGAKKVPPPKFQFAPDVVQACLYFTPPDIFAEKGDTVDLDIVLSNQTNKPADALNFSVLYDPQRATLVETDLESIEARTDSADPIEVTETTGSLKVSARLPKPFRNEQTVLGTLKFQLADAAGKSAIRFLRPPKGTSAVFSKGENILGEPGQGLYGLIDANVFVWSGESARPLVLDSDSASTAPQATAAFLENATPLDTETSRKQDLEGWLHTPPDARRDAETWIALQGPPSPDIAVGQDFWVDLVLMNDALMPVDSLGVSVEFDPAVLEVVDEDQDNWIFLGINIWDGAFHEAYPFDFHQMNQADNNRGLIRYRVARHAGAWDFPTGVFARIHFRAKAPAQSTRIAILRGEGKGRDAHTWLRAFGLDRLDRVWRGARPPSLRLRIAP